MLQLKSVSKTYTSKTHIERQALKDINLSFGATGIVFILGKSGSGKSTLLNILGGLDSATSGEIFVDGQSLADFKQADYDNYRNQYVGFVFQEFNLLNDFNVAGNVALALRLSKEKDINDKVVSALQAVGLSSEYLTRKINELSGGEKQRVAIARAIVKDSKVILADEPTGNLDSATGESIWNILKDLSKTKLVIVVSHDRESAEKYGDRIIEISDGNIISDNGGQPVTQEQAQTFSPKRKRLSNAVCFKMGVNNLFQSKVKSISVVLLAVFTILTILLTQVLLCFSPEKSLAKFIKKNDIDYLELTQGAFKSVDEFRPGCILKPSTANYIEENTTYIKNDCVEKKQDISDMGLSFAGEALELDDNSYYLTSTGLDDAYYSRNSYVEIDGEKVKLIKGQHTAEFLVGKKVDTGSFNSMDYTLAGVIDISKCNPLSENVFPQYFARESFAGRRVSSRNYNASDIPEVTVQFGEVKYTQEFYARDRLSDLAVANSDKVLTENGLRDTDEVTLAEDEIALTFTLYEKLFDADPKWSYVNTDLTEVISMPKHIGQRLPIKFFDYNSGELLIDFGELKITGIVFTTKEYEPKPNYFSTTTIPKFATGANTARKIHEALSSQKYLVQVASIDNLQKFLVNFRNKYDGYVSYAGVDYDYDREAERADYAYFAYGFEEDIYLFKFIFMAIAVLLTLILLLLVINLISFSIVNRKKEIGILSALGATSGDITKIFLIETLLIAGITFIFNLAAILIGITVFNNVFCSGIPLSMPLLRFDYATVLTLVGASFGLLLLAALIPLRKIIKLKPIDAIKSL